MARHRETERKFELDPGADFPDLSDVGAGVATVTEPVETTLEATYYDTAGLALARRGVTLRRRTGGDDAGWHLKLRVGVDDRVEVRQPLGRSRAAPPKTLTDEIRALCRDHDLAPVAVVRTRRTERRLVDADGTPLAVVADDLVQAEPLVPGTTELVTWREVEVELVDGDRSVLTAAARHLAAAGVAASTSTSKLARALGTPAEAAEAAAPGAPGSAGALLAGYLDDQVRELITRDREARAGDVEGIHQMRVATRRLRSALATYRPLLDRTVTDPVRDELRWLGGLLGAVRDPQVQRERLRAMLEHQPSDLVLGPVRRRVDLELQARTRRALASLREALGGERYFRLLDRLDELVATLPTTSEAEAAAADVLPQLVGRSVRRVATVSSAVAASPREADRARRLHEVRKAAKRARYAAESAAPVIGKQARRLARRMEALQDLLGEHQDSVASRALLRELAVAAHAAGENGFTYGLLLAEEQARGKAARVAYPDALRRSLSRKARGWAR